MQVVVLEQVLLIVNSIYGKTMENLRKRINDELINNAKRLC